MKRITTTTFFTLLAAIVIIGLNSCSNDDSDSPKSLNVNLLSGSWELDNNDGSSHKTIYVFAPDNTGAKISGSLTTFIKYSDDEFYCEYKYYWSASDEKNKYDFYPSIKFSTPNKLYDISESAIIQDFYYYKIEKLTSTELWIKSRRDIYNENIIKFKRCEDLNFTGESIDFSKLSYQWELIQNYNPDVKHIYRFSCTEAHGQDIRSGGLTTFDIFDEDYKSELTGFTWRGASEVNGIKFKPIMIVSSIDKYHPSVNYYNIIKVTNDELWIQSRESGEDEIMKFRRYDKV